MPRMWPNQADLARCPITAYQKYKDKRPSEYCGNDDPFYLATHTKYADAEKSAPEDITWFKKQPIGINKLQSLMPKMSEKAGIRRLTNHSARKHLVQKLSNAGVHPNQIMQVTGHRNVNSINNYSALSLQQQRDISAIIANPESAPPTIQPSETAPPPAREPPVQPSLEPVRQPPSTSTSEAVTREMTYDINPSAQQSHPQLFPKELFQNCQLRVDTMNINIVNNYSEPPTKRHRIQNVIGSDSDDN